MRPTAKAVVMAIAHMYHEGGRALVVEGTARLIGCACTLERHVLGDDIDQVDLGFQLFKAVLRVAWHE